jgi:hypothetical protein
MPQGCDTPQIRNYPKPKTTQIINPPKTKLPKTPKTKTNPNPKTQMFWVSFGIGTYLVGRFRSISYNLLSIIYK